MRIIVFVIGCILMLKGIYGVFVGEVSGLSGVATSSGRNVTSDANPIEFYSVILLYFVGGYLFIKGSLSNKNEDDD